MIVLKPAVHLDYDPSLQGSNKTTRLINCFEWLTQTSPYFTSSAQGIGKTNEAEVYLQSYHFQAPGKGRQNYRLALFAGIHGDEIEGILGMLQFAYSLASQPSLAAGYSLLFYPVCNPTGLEDQTRHTRGGHDLQTEFWKNSNAPEARFLEKEILEHDFHGLINLHSHRVSHGFYGQTSDPFSANSLLKPALQAANDFVPLHPLEGEALVLPPQHELRSASMKDHQAFEIILSAPSLLPLHLQLDALTAALHTIVKEHRRLSTNPDQSAGFILA